MDEGVGMKFGNWVVRISVRTRFLAGNGLLAVLHISRSRRPAAIWSRQVRMTSCLSGGRALFRSGDALDIVHGPDDADRTSILPSAKELRYSRHRS